MCSNTALQQSADTLQHHTEVVSPSLSEIYNPDLLDPDKKEHLVEVFDSDKDIDIDITRLSRSGNHFDKVGAEDQESVMIRREEKVDEKQFDKYERE